MNKNTNYNHKGEWHGYQEWYRVNDIIWYIIPLHFLMQIYEIIMLFFII